MSTNENNSRLSVERYIREEKNGFLGGQAGGFYTDLEGPKRGGKKVKRAGGHK